MKINGTVLKYEEDNISTDVIWPGKYTYVKIPANEMINYVMENFDTDFKKKVKDHNILVVGKNFGCGSSREQPAEALKNSGIDAIIAPSFSRIFYRNAINLGLPVIKSENAFKTLKTGDLVSLDLLSGHLILEEKILLIPKYPDFIIDILKQGGLINYIKNTK